MANFDVLNPEQDLLRPYFLEASAGTGKTFAIEHIVTRLLIDSRLNASVEEILVVTFTRAATRELKVRIRENITKVLHILREEESALGYRYLSHFFLSESARQEARHKLEEALVQFEKMQIFTIHGFCQQMLKEFPFEARSDIQGASFDPQLEKQIMREKITDFLRVKVKRSLLCNAQLEKVFRKGQYDVDKVVEKIRVILNKDADHIESSSYEKTLEGFAELIKAYQGSFLEFEQSFYALKENFKGLASIKKELHPHFLAQKEQLFLLLQNKQSLETTLEFFLKEKELFFEKFSEVHLKKTTKESFNALFQKHRWLFFCQKATLLFEKAMKPAHLYLTIASGCREYVEQGLEEKGILKLDQLLKITKEKLESPGFLKKVKEKYKAALIDEFQDTDPIQWGIFRTLFLEERKDFPLFLVGDPKQSIYGFRSADIAVYLEAGAHFPASSKMTLDTNYRSEPKLIEALNTLFTLSSSWLCDKQSLSYQRVKASPFSKNSEFRDGKGSIHFFVLQQEETKEKTFPSRESEESYLYPFIIDEIQRLTSEGFSYKQIAILVKDRFQSQRLERSLKKAEIPYQSSSCVPLKETLAFSFFKTVVSILCHPQDKGQKKLLLAHPFMGFCEEELLDKDFEKPWVHAFNEIQKLIVIYDSEGFLPFWHRFMQTTFHPNRGIFEQELLIHRFIQEYQDLEQVIELILAADDKKKMCAQQMLSYLEEVEEKDPEENALFKRRLLSDQEGVVVMTIHKSKGLEFGVVFALGLCIRHNTTVDIMHEKKEESLLTVFDENEQEHQAFLEKQSQEKMRQLYVALTRAKQRVYIPLVFADLKETKELSPIEAFLDRAFGHIEAEAHHKFIEGLTSLHESGITWSRCEKGEIKAHQLDTKPKEISEPKKFSKQFRSLEFVSYSSLAQPKFSNELEIKNKEGLYPSSKEVGELLHKILEKIFDRGLFLHKDAQSVLSLIEQEVALTCLKGYETLILENLMQLLGSTLFLHDQEIKFEKLSLSHLMTEMEFKIEEEGKYYQGAIDLFFKYGDFYYIIDWKTHDLGEDETAYDHTRLQACMKEHDYFLQQDIYAKVAEKFLMQRGLSPSLFKGVAFVFIRGFLKKYRALPVLFCENKRALC